MVQTLVVLELVLLSSEQSGQESWIVVEHYWLFEMLFEFITIYLFAVKAGFHNEFISFAIAAWSLEEYYGPITLSLSGKIEKFHQFVFHYFLLLLRPFHLFLESVRKEQVLFHMIAVVAYIKEIF